MRENFFHPVREVDREDFRTQRKLKMTTLSRRGVVDRQTKETRIRLELLLDGEGNTELRTGIPFLDHMLSLFAVHGFFDLKIDAEGDLEIDAHHTVEDIGICLGSALAQALGDRKGIRRYGHSVVPMDEALAAKEVTLVITAYHSAEEALATLEQQENLIIRKIRLETNPVVEEVHDH